MKTWVPLLQQSVLITSLLALMIVGTACILWARGMTVPNDLYVVLGVIIGFFFGSKSEQRIGAIVERQQAVEASGGKDANR